MLGREGRKGESSPPILLTSHTPALTSSSQLHRACLSLCNHRACCALKQQSSSEDIRVPEGELRARYVLLATPHRGDRTWVRHSVNSDGPS